jgi:hypothetical protein
MLFIFFYDQKMEERKVTRAAVILSVAFLNLATTSLDAKDRPPRVVGGVLGVPIRFTKGEHCWDILVKFTAMMASHFTAIFCHPNVL